MIQINLSNTQKLRIEDFHYNSIINNLGKKKSIEEFIKNEFSENYSLKDLLIGGKDKTIEIVNLYQGFSRSKQKRVKDQFKYFINQYETKLSSTDKKSKDYYEYNNERYNAYKLCELLNINVCPYCNKNYMITIADKENDIFTRPTLDHFFNKAEYPFLALSLYNLIPSCHICNSHIKKDKNFHINTHIHPYFDDFNSIKKFSISKELLSLLNKTDNFDIVFENRKSAIKKDIERADTYIEDLALDTLYEHHKDKVLELVEISRAYNSDSFENLVSEFKGSTEIFKDVDEIKRLMLCHHIEDENIDKRPLNKLVKDISEELDLI